MSLVFTFLRISLQKFILQLLHHDDDSAKAYYGIAREISKWEKGLPWKIKNKSLMIYCFYFIQLFAQTQNFAKTEFCFR